MNQTSAEFFWITLKRLGYLFYAVSPKDTSFEKLEDVPDYVRDVVPFFIVFILIEKLIHFRRGSGYETNDDLSNFSQALITELVKIYAKGAEVVIYVWVYNNYRLTTLPWDSTLTWFIAFLGIDFMYYVVHRACHQVNIFWAIHQVHHSSEYYNMGMALRVSTFQFILTSIFYIPLALAIPPSFYLVHFYFNLFYQFWLHVDFIGTLGPLEYIFNTPSHHRVHHGRNREYIDKNFGGTLIVWDLLFGTFQLEKEQVVYGLTHPVRNFNAVYNFLFHYVHIAKSFWSMKGLGNKLKVIFYGPGWQPGKPRLGLLEDIPDVKAGSDEPYNPPLQPWCKVYFFLQFAPFLVDHMLIAENVVPYSSFATHALLFSIVYSISTITFVSDHSPHGAIIECSRSLLYLFVHVLVAPALQTLPRSILLALSIFKATSLLSAILWGILAVKPFTDIYKVKKQ